MPGGLPEFFFYQQLRVGVRISRRAGVPPAGAVGQADRGGAGSRGDHLCTQRLVALRAQPHPHHRPNPQLCQRRQPGARRRSMVLYAKCYVLFTI